MSIAKNNVTNTGIVNGHGYLTQVSNNLAQERFDNVSSIRDAKTTKKRWLCCVAEHVKFAKTVDGGLNVRPSKTLSQYELMVKLLKAETCDVIYFDCHLSAAQIGILKMLQMFSGTQLVHARLAMQFDQVAMG
ncbi:hypothetical protein KJ365_01600 [Glaciecola sp. XM2]|uniref:hypothetical protein n=1 Tax=Glaciecola sp. XM2 TaxID=1914931 RepID=UPI001BDE1E5E|nr:hypothetical protein [Glaciecola sp. XM2]MBT1449562.1 hypothetical protein [Glaciecola sp. XM2]